MCCLVTWILLSFQFVVLRHILSGVASEPPHLEKEPVTNPYKNVYVGWEATPRTTPFVVYVSLSQKLHLIS